MNRVKAFSISVCLGLLAVALPPNARADEWNKKTILTVNEPIAVPGKVLQPGKYVMKLMDSKSDRHIVEIYDQNEQHLQTTVIAIPNYRLQPTGKSQFGFWEMPAGEPRALRSWFYPGDNFGQEFAYPKNMAQQIANTNNQNVPSVVSGENNPATAEVQTVQPEKNQQATTAQNNTQSSTSTETQSSAAENKTPPQTAPENNTTAQSTTPPPVQNTPPANTQQNTTRTHEQTTQTASNNASRSRLPSTASPFPLLGLAGLFSLGSALAFRAVAHKRS